MSNGIVKILSSDIISESMNKINHNFSVLAAAEGLAISMPDYVEELRTMIAKLEGLGDNSTIIAGLEELVRRTNNLSEALTSLRSSVSSGDSDILSKLSLYAKKDDLNGIEESIANLRSEISSGGNGDDISADLTLLSQRITDLEGDFEQAIASLRAEISGGGSGSGSGDDISADLTLLAQKITNLEGELERAIAELKAEIGDSDDDSYVRSQLTLLTDWYTTLDGEWRKALADLRAEIEDSDDDSLLARLELLVEKYEGLEKSLAQLEAILGSSESDMDDYSYIISRLSLMATNDELNGVKKSIADLTTEVRTNDTKVQSSLNMLSEKTDTNATAIADLGTLVNQNNKDIRTQLSLLSTSTSTNATALAKLTAKIEEGDNSIESQLKLLSTSTSTNKSAIAALSAQINDGDDSITAQLRNQVFVNESMQTAIAALESVITGDEDGSSIFSALSSYALKTEVSSLASTAIANAISKNNETINAQFDSYALASSVASTAQTVIDNNINDTKTSLGAKISSMVTKNDADNTYVAKNGLESTIDGRVNSAIGTLATRVGNVETAQTAMSAEIDGVRAGVSACVTKDEDGKIESGVYIDATNINLSGQTMSFVGDEIVIDTSNFTLASDGTVYMSGDIYANSLTLGSTVGISANNLTGKLTASQIDATNLSVAAANVTGKLTASQIDATDLSVAAANVTGKLTASQIDASSIKVNAANITGTLTAKNIDASDLVVKAAHIDGELSVSNIYGVDGSGNSVNISPSAFQLTRGDSGISLEIVNNYSLKINGSDSAGVSCNNVPTLKMIYNGNEYILDPSMWVKMSEGTSTGSWQSETYAAVYYSDLISSGADTISQIVGNSYNVTTQSIHPWYWLSKSGNSAYSDYRFVYSGGGPSDRFSEPTSSTVSSNGLTGYVYSNIPDHDGYHMYLANEGISVSSYDLTECGLSSSSQLVSALNTLSGKNPVEGGSSRINISFSNDSNETWNHMSSCELEVIYFKYYNKGVYQSTKPYVFLKMYSEDGYDPSGKMINGEYIYAYDTSALSDSLSSSCPNGLGWTNSSDLLSLVQYLNSNITSVDY